MDESSSKNFSGRELRCKCEQCQQELPNKCTQEAVDALQRIREEFGKPMHITSAYRCRWHPKEIKKQTVGRHRQGLAFDVAVPWGNERMVLVMLAIKHGAVRLGFGKTFLHIDFDTTAPTSWTYK